MKKSGGEWADEVAEIRFVGRGEVWWFAPPPGSTGIVRTFSLASSPHDRGSIMIAMRMRVWEFKTTLLAAPNGTRFEVGRARGSFTLHQDRQRPAVFLAGGIGITPMHSIICWASHEALPHRLFLFYSNRKVEDAAFLENFEELARQNSRFRFVPTITNSVGPSWPYERGRIDAKMLTRRLAELKGPVYYLAGPSGMVTAMWDLLRSLGISEDDIKTEEFASRRKQSRSSDGFNASNSDTGRLPSIRVGFHGNCKFAPVFFALQLQ